MTLLFSHHPAQCEDQDGPITVSSPIIRFSELRTYRAYLFPVPESLCDDVSLVILFRPCPPNVNTKINLIIAVPYPWFPLSHGPVLSSLHTNLHHDQRGARTPGGPRSCSGRSAKYKKLPMKSRLCPNFPSSPLSSTYTPLLDSECYFYRSFR